MQPARIALIVVNYNGAAVLDECLRSALAQDYPQLEIAVVDNGSNDGSAELPVLADPRIRLLRLGANHGFAEANNRAIRACEAEFIALVNNDTVLAPNWATLMVRALDQQPRAGAAACRTLQARNRDKIDAAGFAFYSCCSSYSWYGRSADAIEAERHEPFGPVASAAVYRRTALEEVGLFHPEYFCYYEDTDLAVRLVLFGYRTVYVHDARAYHYGSHTGERYSDFHTYHLRRNAEYLYWVDMVGISVLCHLPFHVAHETLAFLAALRRGQALTAVRAKRDALRNTRFILQQRAALAERLRITGRQRSARKQLTRRMRIGLPLWARYRTERA